MWFLPMLGGLVVGALVGRKVGQAEGISMALLPVAYDPTLGAAYESTLNGIRPLTPEERVMFREALAVTRTYHEALIASGTPVRASAAARGRASLATSIADLVTRQPLRLPPPPPPHPAAYASGHAWPGYGPPGY